MAIDRNVTININDISPSANTAYVDAGKENKVYNKAQVNELVEDLREGTLGSILPSQTLDELNALPDGNYYAAEAGTYAFGVTVPNGWQYRFSKIVADWKVLTKVQIPMQDLTLLQNRVANVESSVNDLYSGISGLEANVSNIDNRLDTLETKAVPNGDIYVGQLDRSVNGDRIEKYLMRNAIAGFKHSFADKYGYEKDSLVHADGRIWKSLVDENKQYPSTSSLTWQEVKFPANADQEFNPDSKNAISNKAVSELASSLKGFEVNEVREVLYSSLTSANAPVINGVEKFSNPKAWLTKINTTSGSGAYNTHIYRNVPTLLQNGSKITKIKLNIVRAAADSAYLLGIKTDGAIDVLIPNIVSHTGIIESFEYDVSTYDKISFMLFYDTGAINNSARYIELYKSELVKFDSVKDYIDKGNSELNNTMNSLFNLDKSKISIIDSNNNLNIDIKQHNLFYVNKTTSVINILPTNVRLIDTFNIYLEVTNVPTLSNTNIVWQNAEKPNFQSGYSYFVLLNTFNGGVSYIGSVIGVWETKNKILFLNKFEHENSLNYDIFGNVSIKSSGDEFEILDSQLSLKTKTNNFPIFAVDTTQNATQEITVEVHSNHVNNILICSNVRDDLKTFIFCGFISAQAGSNQRLYKGSIVNGDNGNNTSNLVTVLEGVNTFRLKKLTNGSVEIYLNSNLIGIQADANGVGYNRVGVAFRNKGKGVKSIKVI